MQSSSEVDGGSVPNGAAIREIDFMGPVRSNGPEADDGTKPAATAWSPSFEAFLGRAASGLPRLRTIATRGGSVWISGRTPMCSRIGFACRIRTPCEVWREQQRSPLAERAAALAMVQGIPGGGITLGADKAYDDRTQLLQRLPIPAAKF
jgi:hypothetical protein